MAMMMDPYLMMHQEKHHRKSKESKEAPKLYYLRKPVWFIGVRCFFPCVAGKGEGEGEREEGKTASIWKFFPISVWPVPVLNSRDFALSLFK